MIKVYIVTEWKVDWDGWQVGNMTERILATTDRDKAVLALGVNEPGWDAYAHEYEDGSFIGSSHGDSAHGKRRKIEVIEVVE